MAEKRLNTRIVHKHETEANWLLSSLVPMQGELIVYDIDENYAYERIKSGDGEKNVNALPFVDDALRTDLLTQIEEVDGKISAVSELVGDTKVSDQISEAIAEMGSVGGADWNQDDPNGAGYIANRTHYTETEKWNEIFILHTDAPVYKQFSTSAILSGNYYIEF